MSGWIVSPATTQKDEPLKGAAEERHVDQQDE